MSIHANPVLKCPERAFTLQKYLLLNSQHDILQNTLQHLASSPPSSAATSPTSSLPPAPNIETNLARSENNPAATSPKDTSPTSTTTLRPVPASLPALHHRRSSLPPSFHHPAHTDPLSPLNGRDPQDATSSTAYLAEEEKLLQVNQQIKSTLTELLNCESVRQDRLYSVWVQTRLMDAEKELRGGRRHCHSVGGVGGRRRSVAETMVGMVGMGVGGGQENVPRKSSS